MGKNKRLYPDTLALDPNLLGFELLCGAMVAIEGVIALDFLIIQKNLDRMTADGSSEISMIDKRNPVACVYDEVIELGRRKRPAGGRPAMAGNQRRSRYAQAVG